MFGFLLLLGGFFFVYSLLPSPREAAKMRKRSSASLTPQCPKSEQFSAPERCFALSRFHLLPSSLPRLWNFCPDPKIPLLTLKFPAEASCTDQQPKSCTLLILTHFNSFPPHRMPVPALPSQPDQGLTNPHLKHRLSRGFFISREPQIPRQGREISATKILHLSALQPWQ